MRIEPETPDLREAVLALNRIAFGGDEFYPRFGFCHGLVGNTASPFTEHDAFRGLELSPGVLAGKAGTCAYPPAFGG
jgi:predicted N-acetyltransferase YhbS